MLDTSTCVHVIRTRSPAAIARLRRHEIKVVAVSTIVLSELLYGAERSADPVGNRLVVSEFCAPFSVLEFDDHAASAYARVRDRLERRGQPIGPLDTLIGAHALALGATLVTHNPREFKRIAGLTVEDWTATGGR